MKSKDDEEDKEETKDACDQSKLITAQPRTKLSREAITLHLLYRL